MRACRRAGLAVPEVLVDDDGTLLGTAGLVMAPRGGRDARAPDPARRRVRRAPAHALVDDLGRFLAGLHAIDPAEVPGRGRHRPARRSTGPLRAGRRPEPDVREGATRGSSPTGRRARRRRSCTATCASGNVIVDDDGLAAAIDWELVHVGDPARGPRLAVRQGVAVRRAARGRRARHDRRARRRLRGAPAAGPVDRDALHWWLVAEDAAVGHRLHGSGVGAPLGRGALRTSWPPSAGGSPSRSGT